MSFTWGRAEKVRPLAFAAVVAAAACGEAKAPPYAIRYELIYGADLTQSVSLRWGTALATSSTGNVISLEQRFVTRDQAGAFQQPVDVMVGGTAIFSETPRHSECDVVGDVGVDPADVRLARFSRAIDTNSVTVLKVARSNDRPALFCYTTSNVVGEGQPSRRDQVEVLSLLHLPVGAYTFTIDGQDLLPVAVGRDDRTHASGSCFGSLRPSGPGSRSARRVVGRRPRHVISRDHRSVSGPPRREAADSPGADAARADGMLAMDVFAALICCYEGGVCSTAIP